MNTTRTKETGGSNFGRPAAQYGWQLRPGGGEGAGVCLGAEGNHRGADQTVGRTIDLRPGKPVSDPGRRSARQTKAEGGRNGGRNSFAELPG